MEWAQAPPWHGAHAGLLLCKGKWQRAFPLPGHKPQSVICQAQLSPHPLCFDLPDNTAAQPCSGQFGGGFGGARHRPLLCPAQTQLGQCQGALANLQLWHSRSQEQHPWGVQPPRRCPSASHADMLWVKPRPSSSLHSQGEAPRRLRLPSPRFAFECLQGGREAERNPALGLLASRQAASSQGLEEGEGQPRCCGMELMQRATYPEGWRHPSGELTVHACT